MAREGQGYPRWRRDMMMMMIIKIAAQILKQYKSFLDLLMKKKKKNIYIYIEVNKEIKLFSCYFIKHPSLF